jgi:hypothetical protein
LTTAAPATAVYWWILDLANERVCIATSVVRRVLQFAAPSANQDCSLCRPKHDSLCPSYLELSDEFDFYSLRATEIIVKQSLIVLIVFGAAITTADAHGLRQHVCRWRGAHGYYCHWHPVPSLRQALLEARANAEAVAAGILYRKVIYSRWCAYPNYE